MRKAVSVLTILILILSLTVSSFAMVQGEIDQVIQPVGVDKALERAWGVIKADEGKSLMEISDENNANYYHYNPYGHMEPIDPQLEVSKNDSWDSIINELFSKYNIEQGQDNIALTYYNTVTGESHSYNADDRYFVTASLFKVPLCMLVAEKVSDGKLTMSEESIFGYSFEYLEWRSLAHSDNAAAMVLEEYLGGFVGFRDQQVKYMGENPKDDLGDSTYYESYNTAKQITNCLKTLYAEPERYPGVIENMLIDTPYEYFKMWDRRYPTAQKWGYVPHDGKDYVNNCGIIYTDQPIILVVMTESQQLAYDIIGEYATLMIDYTNFRIEEYKVIEQAAKTEAMSVLQDRHVEDYVEPLNLTEKVSEVDSEANRSNSNKEFRMSVLSSIILLVIVSMVVFALVFIYRRNKGSRVKPLWAVLAVLIAGAALILCVIAFNTGSITAEVEGNPQDTVRTFFDCLTVKDYETAYSCLSDYSSLGLENEPGTEEGKLIFDELKKSWSYIITEEPEINKMNATQIVKFRYLDIKALEDVVANQIPEVLDKTVQSKEHDEVYDSNDKYLPSITDEVYLTCLQNAINKADNCYKTVDIPVKLVYENGKWLIQTSDELLLYLLGGIS